MRHSRDKQAIEFSVDAITSRQTWRALLTVTVLVCSTVFLLSLVTR
jgi:hypothetical protein